MKRTEECFAPVRTVQFGEDRFFDFGKNYYAVLEVEAEASRVQEIILAVGEDLNAEGRLEEKPGGWRIYQEQIFPLQPGMNRITMCMTRRLFVGGKNYGKPTPAPFVPFRYAEVRGFTGPVKVFQHAFFYEFD
ncbi:MAG: family 78 glycoside hydrolase catalytic domain, partial [Lentisphaeria bacterium]|nr:family 78 glycoside hydrolase catalytic domain [Lentisphaeria bacterium]